LSQGDTRTGLEVTLQRGAPAYIRIGDAQQLLRKAEKGPDFGPPLLIQIDGVRGGVRAMPVSDDDNGRTFRVVVPFDTDMTLRIRPGKLLLRDKTGKQLTDGGVQAPGKRNDYSQTFRIGKQERGKTFEFAVGATGN